MTHSIDAVWQILSGVMDPEIPVVSLVDMGIIRDVRLEDGRVIVQMTPTFSGCPALEVMKTDIARALEMKGYTQTRVDVVLAPPWSTDWITEQGRKKLRDFGIAPPHVHQGDVHNALLMPVACPRCSSMKTSLRNTFGPTPCRMIFTCLDCSEPFEQFKPL